MTTTRRRRRRLQLDDDDIELESYFYYDAPVFGEPLSVPAPARIWLDDMKRRRLPYNDE
jgi:hypothetical protein